MKKTIGISIIIAVLLAFMVLAAPTSDNPFIGAHNDLSGSLFTGTVAYWEFECNANDETGVNNETVNGPTQTDEGRVGNAYEFSFNDIELGLSGFGSSEGSMSIWVKPGTGQISNPEILSRNLGGKNVGDFQFVVQSSTDDKFVLAVDDGVSADINITA